MEYVLLVWNQFNEGNSYYLFQVGTKEADLAQVCNGHYINHEDMPEEVEQPLEDLNVLLESAQALGLPLQLPYGKSAKVTVVESGFVP